MCGGPINNGALKVAANFNEHARHCMDMGGDVGSPDLRIEQLRNDGITHILYLEIKTKTGRLSQDQLDWNANFDACFLSKNCTRAVARGYKEALKIIDGWLLG